MSQKGVFRSERGITRVICGKAIYFEWKIPNLLMLSKYIQSSTFSFCDAEWFIRFGRSTEEISCVQIQKEPSSCAFRASYFVAVLKADGSVFKSVHGIELVEKGEWLSQLLNLLNSDIYSLKDDLLPNGTLTVLFNVCPLNQISQAITRDPETLSQNLKQLYLSGTNADVTFQVKDRQILAHKLILTARSTVFDTMFKADMVEKNNGTVNISDSDPDHFEKFLTYLYTGDLNVVSPINASGLYYLADKYNLKELKDICCQILTRDICLGNFFDAAALAFLLLKRNYWRQPPSSSLNMLKLFFILLSGNCFLQITPLLPMIF